MYVITIDINLAFIVSNIYDATQISKFTKKTLGEYLKSISLCLSVRL